MSLGHLFGGQTGVCLMFVSHLFGFAPCLSMLGLLSFIYFANNVAQFAILISMIVFTL